MLYVDSSALVKCYLRERGTDAMIGRLGAQERVFSSILTFAEVHSTLAKRFLHQRPRGETIEHARRGLDAARDAFRFDWMFSVNVVEVTTQTLSNFADLVERFGTLRAADAIQLASALWLRDKAGWPSSSGEDDLNVEFATADRKLAKVARSCGLAVFDPEAS
jgi:predicted nucleic acid-binding protein